MLNMTTKVATRHKPLIMLFVFAAAILFNASAAQAQNNLDKRWTVVGSSGAVDEASLSNYSANNFTIGVLNTGTITVRYNIVATDGIARLNPAASSTIVVRFRDQDCANTGTRVLFTIRETSLTVGGNNVLYTFDSNAAPTCAENFFQTVTETLVPIDFDFANNAYWIEAEITKTVAGTNAQLGSIQIFETQNPPPMIE